MTRSPSKTRLLRELGATPVVADAFDADAVTRAVTGAQPEAVVNLLTDLNDGDSASNARLRELGTRHLLDAAEQAGVGRVVAESISWVYRSAAALADESQPLDVQAAEPRRTTIYGVQTLENAVRALPDGVVLRFGLLYGPGTWYSREGRYGRAAQDGRLTATETVASFIHVADAAQAIAAALDWPAGIWNIVDDAPAPGLDWAPVFAAALDAPPPTASSSGDIGRPVSNARARAQGLALEYPHWRDGFSEL
jgi:nucleoside-diphosphate-sugar epimerase